MDASLTLKASTFLNAGLIEAGNTVNTSASDKAYTTKFEDLLRFLDSENSNRSGNEGSSYLTNNALTPDAQEAETLGMVELGRPFGGDSTLEGEQQTPAEVGPAANAQFGPEADATSESGSEPSNAAASRFHLGIRYFRIIVTIFCFQVFCLALIVLALIRSIGQNADLERIVACAGCAGFIVLYVILIRSKLKKRGHDD